MTTYTITHAEDGTARLKSPTGYCLVTVHPHLFINTTLGDIIDGVARRGDKVKDVNGKYLAGDLGDFDREQLSPETSA